MNLAELVSVCEVGSTRPSKLLRIVAVSCVLWGAAIRSTYGRKEDESPRPLR